MQKPELLAPAGDRAAFEAAIAAGADAVYLGAGAFNARRNAGNFAPAELAAACRDAHLRGRKVYLTANTLVFEGEADEALHTVAQAAEAGVDAAIIQDVGLAQALRRALPELELHTSTQMNIRDAAGIELAQRLGFSRVTLARELSLKRIAQLAQRGMPLECFVHGALCICQSGQCLLSSMIGGRSANRGLCAQPCRLPYKLVDEEGKQLAAPGAYLLSPKDLCGLDLLGQLVKAGAASLKIEGRMKAPEYVCTVTSVYRQALDRLWRTLQAGEGNGTAGAGTPGTETAPAPAGSAPAGTPVILSEASAASGVEGPSCAPMDGGQPPAPSVRTPGAPAGSVGVLPVGSAAPYWHNADEFAEHRSPREPLIGTPAPVILSGASAASGVEGPSRARAGSGQPAAPSARTPGSTAAPAGATAPAGSAVAPACGDAAVPADSGADAFAPLPEEHALLAEAFSRGFTPAYLTGQRGNEMMGYTRPNNRGVAVGRVAGFSGGRVLVDATAPLQRGDVLELWTRKGRITHTCAHGDDLRCGAVKLSIEQPVAKGDRVFRVRSAALGARVQRQLERGWRIPVRMSVCFPGVGQPIEVTLGDFAGHEVRVQGPVVELARSKPITPEEVQQHMSRFGGTPYDLRECNVSLLCSEGEEFGCGFSTLHKLRARAVEALERQILAASGGGGPAGGSLGSGPQLACQPAALGSHAASQPVTLQAADGGPQAASQPAAVLEPQAASRAVETEPVCGPVGGDLAGVPAPAAPSAQPPAILSEASAASGVEGPSRARAAGSAPAAAAGSDAPAAPAAAAPVAPAHAAPGPLPVCPSAASVPAAAPAPAAPPLARIATSGPEMAAHATTLDFSRPLAGGNVARTLAEFAPGRAIGPKLYATNAEALQTWAALGASFVWLSPELTLHQIRALAEGSPLPLGLVVSGRQELMVSDHCFLAAEGPCNQQCARCKRRLGAPRFYEDRKGYRFPVCADEQGCGHLYNAVPLDLTHAVGDLLAAGVRGFAVDATLMGQREARAELDRVKSALNGRKLQKRPGTTTGHLFRHVR